MPRPLDNYVSVNERVESATPEVLSPIRTVAIHAPAMLTEHMGYIRVRVTLEDGRSAYGTASFDLSLTGKTAQATNPIEDCETSAVGRALAFLGYHANRSIASREEVQEAQRRQAARPERPNGRPVSEAVRTIPPPAPVPTLTDAQKRVAAAFTRAQITGQDAVDILGKYGAERISELTDHDATMLAAEVAG
jgi:hypothetical protein